MTRDAFKYYFRQASKSLKKNKVTTLASISTTVATLFILGAFMAFIFNVSYMTEQFSRGCQIQVFIDETLDECNRWERALLDSLFVKRRSRSQRLRDKERERLVALELESKRSVERANCLMKVQYKLQRAGITKDFFKKELISIPLIQSSSRIVLKKREGERRETHSSVS